MNRRAPRIMQWQEAVCPMCGTALSRTVDLPESEALRQSQRPTPLQFHALCAECDKSYRTPAPPDYHP